jgi:hypothetical protein
VIMDRLARYIGSLRAKKAVEGGAASHAGANTGE